MSDTRDRLDALLRERILVLDGAWGTMIQNARLDPEDYRGERFADHTRDVAGDPDLLNLTRPDVVLEIHRQYLAAGADITTTNTFTVRRLGALDQQGRYRGSSRRGPDGQGQPSAPLALRELFGGIPDFYVQTDWWSQPTMMQVAGGMDRLPAALAARLGNRIVYRAAVREIRQSERGVWAIYADADGRPRRVDADYCVCTIPLPVLRDLQKDFSPPVQAAIAAAEYDGAGKIGLQFRRRFWEQDDDIYGGRSWTDQEIGQIIYPSHGFNTSKGVLIGYYLDFRQDHARASSRRSAAAGTRARCPRAPAVRDRVRDRLLGDVGARAVEPGVMAIGVGRCARRARRRCANRTAASTSPATT